MYPEHFYSVDDIARHARGHTHWFDRDSMRFFNSRLGVNVYRTANPFVSLFVSSERCDWGDHREFQLTPRAGGVPRGRWVMAGHPRLYSVRSYDCRTRDVDTVGEFQGYTSSAAANRAARRLAGEIIPSLDDLHEWAIAINERFDQDRRRARARGERGFVADDLGYINLEGVTA